MNSKIEHPSCIHCQATGNLVVPVASGDIGKRDSWVCIECGKEWEMDPRALVIDVVMLNIATEDEEGLERIVHAASAYLDPQQHDIDCPVRAGASADCCWPSSVCVPDDFFTNLTFYKQLSENQA